MVAGCITWGDIGALPERMATDAHSHTLLCALTLEYGRVPQHKPVCLMAAHSTKVSASPVRIVTSEGAFNGQCITCANGESRALMPPSRSSCATAQATRISLDKESRGANKQTTTGYRLWEDNQGCRLKEHKVEWCRIQCVSICPLHRWHLHH